MLPKIAELLESVATGTGAPVRRSWVCATCRGPAVPQQMFCAPCQAAERAERRSARLADAWASLPERYREADKLPWEGRRLAVVSGAEFTSVSVLIHGPAGAGKTAMACALFIGMLRAAESAEATWHTVEEAASSRYVSDYALTQAASAHALGQGDPPLYRQALRAPTLVLDELGYDLTDRRHVSKDLIFARHDAGRRTIITTGQGQERFAALWGSGAARRIWGESAVIALGPRVVTKAAAGAR